MSEPILELKAIDRDFTVSGGLFSQPLVLRALQNVSLSVKSGETLGLVGESGSGKSTVAKIMLGLLKPTQGEVLVDGKPIANMPRREFVRQIQPVFQDPYSSLNPCRTVIDLVNQPLKIHGLEKGNQHAASHMLDRVGFPQRLANSYPGELSGGQRQRVAIARALILKPKVLICDEPTSALDVSVQAQIINLLLELRKEFGLTMLFVSHNLAVVEHLADRVAVMYLGEIVEQTNAKKLFQQPKHPYTQALFASTLSPVPGRGLPKPQLGASAADPFATSKGCRFAPRCLIAQEQCSEIIPKLRNLDGSDIRCHLA